MSVTVFTPAPIWMPFLPLPVIVSLVNATLVELLTIAPSPVQFSIVSLETSTFLAGPPKTLSIKIPCVALPEIVLFSMTIEKVAPIESFAPASEMRIPRPSPEMVLCSMVTFEEPALTTIPA